MIFCGMGSESKRYGSNVLLSCLHWLQRKVEWSWALKVLMMILWLASAYSAQARRASSAEDSDDDEEDEADDDGDMITEEKEF